LLVFISSRDDQPQWHGLAEWPMSRAGELSPTAAGLLHFRTRPQDKTKMKLRPLYDRLLVTRTEEQHKTTGGLFIPDSAKEKPMEARVVAVGNGKVQEDGTLRKLEVKAGDKVLFAKYSGNEIKIDGTDHLILREDDVLAVID
jgi:chaperonin GroES